MKLLTFTAESNGAEMIVSEIPAEAHAEAELWREQMLGELFNFSQ